MKFDSSSVNPYDAPVDCSLGDTGPAEIAGENRGPAFYLATGGFLGAAIFIAIVVATPFHADPHPLGYVCALAGVPFGGLAYRIRSCRWPIDRTARSRQLGYAALTLILPIGIAMLTGMRAQGLHMTVLAGVISITLIIGFMLSGRRRNRIGAPSFGPERR